MKPRVISNLSVLFILTLLASLANSMAVSMAQEEVVPTGNEVRTGGSSPRTRASTLIKKEINILLSEQDLSIWFNASRNVYGNWTWTLPEDAEILDIEFDGTSYEVQENQVFFSGLNGYARVVYRTSDGIQRDGRYLTFAESWDVSEPFDLDAEVNYPEFYSDYIASIVPDGYIQEPGNINWSLVNIENWEFEVKFDLGTNIIDIKFPEGNKAAHHTQPWPGNVFRRAQWLSVQVDFEEGAFNPDTDSLRWSVKGPADTTFIAIPAWTADLPATSWAVYAGSLMGQSWIDEIFLPVNLPVGRYTLRAESYRSADGGSIFQDAADSPEFIVIFNPWNDDDDSRFDPDVYNPNFNATELDAYAQAATSVNFYGDSSLTPFVFDGNPIRVNLAPFDDSIFYPVIDEIEGYRSARAAMEVLVDKARWDDDTPTANEVLDGQWGAGNYRRDWRNVPAIMQAWDNGNDHPTGQCMDFGSLVSAFAQATGIPSRMLTCVGCDGWNFHVWNEVWTNAVSTTSWSPADGTYGIGPTTPQDPQIQQEIAGGGTALYTYDARTDSRIDVLDQYISGATSRVEPAEAVPQAVNLGVSTDQTVYSFGDTVTVEVTATNTDSSDVTSVLETEVRFVDYAGSYDLYTFPDRNVTIPAGGTITETYTLTQNEYQYSGDFRVLTTLGSATGTGDFSINSGLAMTLTAPATANVGDSLTVSLQVTNTLATAISDVAVEVYFPASVSGVNSPVTVNIPAIAAGATYETAWTVGVEEAGPQSIVAFAFSADTGSAQASTTFEALGPADLAVQIEGANTVTPGTASDITARVRNDGGQPATGVQVVLSLADGLSAGTAITVALGDLAPGEEKTVTWPVTAAAAGVYALRVTATETSVGDMEIADQLIVAVQTPLTIKLTADRTLVTQGEKIQLTLTNSSNTEARVVLDIVSNNPSIGFRLLDPATGELTNRVVTVPAQSTRTFTLVVNPAQYENGQITIHATTEQDPNAADYVTISVRDPAQVFTVFLPALAR